MCLQMTDLRDCLDGIVWCLPVYGFKTKHAEHQCGREGLEIILLFKSGIKTYLSYGPYVIVKSQVATRA